MSDKCIITCLMCGREKCRRGEECLTFCNNRLGRRLDEVEEAAEEYWEAWQDAAIYWKDEVRRLRWALEMFGVHRCGHGMSIEIPCTCGLNDVLNQ